MHVFQVVIDYIKFDIEGSEWSALEAMYSSKVLANVKQIAFEIHVPRDNTVAGFYQKWKTLKRLEEFGFRRWYWALNYRGRNVYIQDQKTRSCCYEMVYINTNYLRNETLA